MGATIAYACGRETHVYTIDTTFLLYLQKKKSNYRKLHVQEKHTSQLNVLLIRV